MYSDGEALLLTRVQACTGFSATNTSRADWRMLNNGKSAFYAILRPGPFTSEPLTPCTRVFHWTSVIEVWQQYTADGQAHTNLYANAASIMTGLLPWPKIGDATGLLEENAGVEGGEDPQEMWIKDGGPQWLRWQLRVRWSEEIAITYSE